MRFSTLQNIYGLLVKQLNEIEVILKEVRKNKYDYEESGESNEDVIKENDCELEFWLKKRTEAETALTDFKYQEWR